MKSLVDTQKVSSTPVITIVPSPPEAKEVRPPSTAKMDAMCLRLLTEGRSITANIDAHGVSKVANASSSSSNRQKAAFVKPLLDTYMYCCCWCGDHPTTNLHL